MTDTATGQPAQISDGDLNEQVRIYEVGYLLVPTTAEADVPREVTALKDILEKGKAAVISEEFPKLRALAYPMHKRKSGGYDTCASGYFGWVKFEADAAIVRHIDEALRRNEKVLRYLIIKTVRESTLSAPRPPRASRAPQAGSPPASGAPKGAPAPAPVSEAELDKSIEKLIAE